jgi:hypothetical protein
MSNKKRQIKKGGMAFLYSRTVWSKQGLGDVKMAPRAGLEPAT